jgi:hypothetical protein
MSMSSREAAERRASLAQPDEIVRLDPHRSGGMVGQGSINLSARTAAEIKRFKDENPEPIPSLRKEDYATYWTPEKHVAAVARNQEAERQRREQERQRREQAEEQARQRTQVVLADAARQELLTIFVDATGDEWSRATEMVKAQGLIGTLLAPDAFRSAIAEIRRSND